MTADKTDAGERKTVTVPGHSWITGSRPPKIEGWEVRWVNHYGVERTEFVYRPIQNGPALGLQC